MASATWGTSPPPDPTGLRMYVQFHPYSGGFETSVWRLSPKVNVVTTRATANTDPSSAERTGTAARPSPGSSAIRTPTTPGADSPARASGRHHACP